MSYLSRPAPPLAFAGVVMIMAYAGLTFANNLIASTNPAFLGVPMILWVIYAIYFLVFRFALSRPDIELSLVVIVVVAVVIGLVLVLSVPVGQNDFYHYFFEDVVWQQYGRNPYFTIPAQLPLEPAGIVSGWQQLPSQHGPARALLTLPAWFLSGGSLVAGMFWYRALFLCYLIGALLLIYQIAARINCRRPRLSALVFGWSPLVLYGTLLQGGTDILLVFWLLLALLWAIDKRIYLSLGALVISVFIKYVTVLLLPLFVWFYLKSQPSALKKIIAGCSFAVVISFLTVLLWLPFWRGSATLDGMTWVASHFDVNSVPGFVMFMASHIWSHLNLASAKLIFVFLFVVSYLAVTITMVRRSELTAKQVIVSAAWVLGLYLVLGKFWFYAKYLIWLLPLFCLLDMPGLGAAVFFSGLIVLSPVYSNVLIILLPPALIFSLYFFLQRRFPELHLV